MDFGDCDDLVPVKTPGPAKLKDVTVDTELYIFRIPKGLVWIYYLNALLFYHLIYSLHSYLRKKKV